MAILNVGAIPGGTRLWWHGANDLMDVRHHMVDPSNPELILTWEGKYGKNVSGVWLNSVEEINPARPAIRALSQKGDTVVLIGAVHLMLGDQPIKTLSTKISSVWRWMEDSIKHPNEQAEILLKSNPNAETIPQNVAEVAMGNSVLDIIQTAVYRVPKDQRDGVKLAVYRYLGGFSNQFGLATQWPSMVSVLTNEVVLRLRVASLAVQNQKISIQDAAERYKVDAFDIRFLIETHRKNGA